MTMTPTMLYILIGGAAFFLVVIAGSLSGGDAKDLERRLARVGPQGTVRKLSTNQRIHAVRHSGESGIAILNIFVRLLPNPDKIRSRLARTGRNLTLGEYLLMNALALLAFFVLFHMLQLAMMVQILLSVMLGIGLPHFIISSMGNKRIKKFLAHFPEAIDTMCRGLRSGLPVTESIASVGREMPDPVGLEFHRISDGVHMGKTLESAMWEVARRIDVPEYRFLIIAMAIQKETGGNLAETMGNLADLIRKRRQLRLKVKAMSSEAKASAMIIGSLPFIMFILLLLTSPQYVLTLFQDIRGKILIGVGMGWMSIGWAVMTKMINFEL